MSRTRDLLDAVAAMLRGLTTGSGAAFQDVRVELDRYDLGDLLKDSTRTPCARVCFMKGAAVRREPGHFDRDVSIAIVVVAGRSGRPSREIASADAAVLDLIDLVVAALGADPYVGLTRLSACELGDELVAVSEATSQKGMAIGLVEAKWRLLDVMAGHAEPAATVGMGPDTASLTILAGDDTIAGGGP